MYTDNTTGSRPGFLPIITFKPLNEFYLPWVKNPSMEPVGMIPLLATCLDIKSKSGLRIHVEIGRIRIRSSKTRTNCPVHWNEIIDKQKNTLKTDKQI